MRSGDQLEFRSTVPDKIVLRGAAEYQANVSPSPVGIISSLEHAARSIESAIERCRQNLTRVRKDSEDLAALAGRVFEHEERYRELVARQTALIGRLDLGRDQAPALGADLDENTAMSEPASRSLTAAPSVRARAPTAANPARKASADRHRAKPQL